MEIGYHLSEICLNTKKKSDMGGWVLDIISGARLDGPLQIFKIPNYLNVKESSLCFLKCYAFDIANRDSQLHNTVLQKMIKSKIQIMAIIVFALPR